MYPALSAAAASVAMANAGKMRDTSTESSKKSAVSKLLLKPTRLPKTAPVMSGVRGRDNLGFVPGPASCRADVDMADSPGRLPTTSSGVNAPSPNCQNDNDAETHRPEEMSTNVGPGTRETLLAMTETPSPPIDRDKCFMRPTQELVGELTFRRIREEGAYRARSLGAAVRSEMLANAVQLSKCGSTTALEALYGRRSESPIYEELDFRSASVRDLNSDPSKRRLESPNISDSSSELSTLRRGLPFPVRGHSDHRRQYSSPSCGVRIAEMRATRKYDGLRISPSATLTTTTTETNRIRGGGEGRGGGGIDRTQSQPNGKGTLVPTDTTTFRRSASSLRGTEGGGAENHRSSLDLNVTYVEYFDEKRTSPAGSLQTTTTSICSPVVASSSHSSSVSSLAEEAINRTSSASPVNSLQGQQRTAAQRDRLSGGLRTAPKLVETSTQTGGGVGGGGTGKEKRQIRPIGFTASENRFTKSSAARKAAESDKRQDSGTGILSQKRVTLPAGVSSFSRPLTVRRSISEPDGGGGPASSDGSGSLLSSPDTLIDSEISLGAEERAANDDDNPASSSSDEDSELTDDDDHHHFTRHSGGGGPPCHPGGGPPCRPSLGIRGAAAQKRPQPSPPPPPVSGSVRVPSQLRQGPSMQRRHQPSPTQYQSPSKANKSIAQPTTTTPPVCLLLLPRQGTTSTQHQHQAPSPTTSPMKPSIQRIENFGQMAADSHKDRVSVTQPLKLSKSSSSTELNRNSLHLQAPIMRRNKPSGNTSGLPSDLPSAPRNQNPRPRIPPSPAVVRTTVRRVQSSDPRLAPPPPPPPIPSHSSTSGVSSTSSSKSKSIATVRRESGSASTRTDERSRVIGCNKDSQSSMTSLRSIAPVASSNKLIRQNTAPPSEGSGKKPCSGRLPTASDNLVTPLSQHQQQLSPIAERSPLPRSSMSSGESIAVNVTRNLRGQVASRILPSSGANSTITQFHRTLSSSQRALSMSKISSTKSTSYVTSGTATKCDTQRPSDTVATPVSSTKLISKDDSISKTSEISKSYANIFEEASAVKGNSPISPLQQRTAADGARVGAASCMALNIHPEPTHRPLENQAPDCVRLRPGNRTSGNEMKSEVRPNSSAPSSAADSQSPDYAMTSPELREARGIPVRADRTKEVKSGAINEQLSSRLRTPTDFSNSKKSEKSADNQSSVRSGPRTATSQTLSGRNEESEAVVTPTSVFKQLQLKHVKPYTSASNRGASVTATRGRGNVEGGNIRHKVAGSAERNSSTINCSHAMASVGPSTRLLTGLDSSSVASNIQEQENRLDDHLPNSESCSLDHSLDDAIKTRVSLSDTKGTPSEREEDGSSDCCDMPESTSRMHSVSSFECAETWTSDQCKRDSFYARNDDIFSENHRDITDDVLSNPSKDMTPVTQEIKSRSVPITQALDCTDPALVAQLLVSGSRTGDVSDPDLIQISEIVDASLSSQIQSGGKNQSAESGTDNEDVTDRPAMSAQCMSSDVNCSSVVLSGDVLLSETECFNAKADSDCASAVSDFSERTLQRDDRGGGCSIKPAISGSLDVTDAVTVTDEDCCRSSSAAEIRSQISTDLSAAPKTEKLKMDHGSQTMLSDVGCHGDNRLHNRSNRNSLILQNKIIVDQDPHLRDIERFVVTYESENIIVLERADSISCPAPLDHKDEFYDRTLRSNIPTSLTSTDIGQKWGKNSMSSSRSVDLRMVTMPKGESGSLPLSESGYDSWKSQSSKSSTRCLKLSDGEAGALSGRSNLPEMVNRRSGLEGTYDRRSKDSEIRCSAIQPCLGTSAGYLDGCSSGGTTAMDEASSAASRKYGSENRRLKCGFSGSETEVNSRRERNSDVGVRHRGLPSLSDISTSDGGEIDASSCNYFQDDDDVSSLTMQASGTVEDLFRDEASGGGRFSSSFSSFPSSNSSLMDTLESMSLNRSDSNEGFAEVWSALSTRRPSTKLCLHPDDGKTSCSLCRDSLFDRPIDPLDFTSGMCYELSSNATAALHSRDYHNRIYTLDFGAGDSGDFSIDPEEADLGDQQDVPLLPSSSWMEEGNVQSSGKIISDQSTNSAVVKHEQLESLENSSISKLSHFRPSSRDFGDENFKQSLQSDNIHSGTFPLAVRKVLTTGGMTEEEEAVRAVVENCGGLFSKRNVRPQRKQSKETFYENMCDELLESLEANLSDSDNTPSPTAQDLEANSDALTRFGKNSSRSAAASREKFFLDCKKSIPSEADKAVMSISNEDSILDAKDKQTLCWQVTKEPNCDAIHYRLLESGPEKSTGSKSTSEDQEEKSRETKFVSEELLPVSGKAICPTPTTASQESSLPNTVIVLLDRPGLGCQMNESNHGEQVASVGEQIRADKRQSMVDCKETSTDTQHVSHSICNLAQGSSPKGDQNQRANASSLSTLPLAEPVVAKRNSSDFSPSDSMSTCSSKDEPKSGFSSAGLLTRYFPGLLRRQAKDRHTSPEIVEQRSGRRHDTSSRNSAPVSYDRRSRDVDQEPRSVKDVIRKFEDKTAASASQGDALRSSTAVEKPSSDDHKAGSSIRSKFGRKPKS